MEIFTEATAVFIRPVVALFVPTERTYWLYFYSAFVIAIVAQMRNAGQWSYASFSDGIKRLFSKVIWGHRSAMLDYKMLFLNNLGYFYLFPLITVNAGLVAELTIQGLTILTGTAGLGLTPGWGSRAAITVIWLIAWDFGFFIAHYLQHRIPFLWEFHKAHHSAEVMTPFTVFRMHPIDDLLTYSTVGAMAGMLNGCSRFIYADPLHFYVANGLNLFWFLALMAGYHLRHSHVWIMYPEPFRSIFSSPALHLIHHSNNPKHFDTNFARIFIFWDWLAGTLYMPKRLEAIRFGLGGEEREYQTLRNIYLRPFKMVLGRMNFDTKKYSR